MQNATTTATPSNHTNHNHSHNQKYFNSGFQSKPSTKRGSATGRSIQSRQPGARSRSRSSSNEAAPVFLDAPGSSSAAHNAVFPDCGFEELEAPDWALSRAQVWELLGIRHPEELRRLIKRGQLAPYRVGRRQFFDCREVAILVQSRQTRQVSCAARSEMVRSIIEPLLLGQVSKAGDAASAAINQKNNQMSSKPKRVSEIFKRGVISVFYESYRLKTREMDSAARAEYRAGREFAERVVRGAGEP